MCRLNRHEGKSLGLLVRQLIDIEWLDTKQIKLPNAELFSRQMSDFLQGYFIHDSEEMIIAVDAAAIIQAQIWEIHN